MDFNTIFSYLSYDYCSKGNSYLLWLTARCRINSFKLSFVSGFRSCLA